MEACEIEDLLSSFSSDAFAVQSQSEKDLRASLQTFFALNSNQNENKERGTIFGTGSHTTTLPTHPWSRNPGTPMESGSNEIWNQEVPLPKTPMGTPARTNGFKMSTSPPLSRHGHHYNSPTLSHRTIGDLVNVGQNSNTVPINCLACLYKLQNPSQFSTILPNQHQEGCDYLQSLPNQLQHTICKPTHHLHLDPSLDQQFSSIEMEL